MACFPRLFHHRSKNKFTPAEDENTDTILNTHDSPVQIGQYIRREEKPLYSPIVTPSASEAKLQRLRQQPPGSPPAPARWTLQSVAENGSANNGVQERKFRSNKDKLQAQDACPSGGSAINVTRSSSKLKPVKERRPTALPTEVPSIEIEDVRDAGDGKDSLGERVALQPGANAHVDVVDGGGKSKLKVNVNGIIDEGVAHDDDDDTPSSTSIATTPVTEGPVKFFIGHTQELSPQQTDDTLSCQSSDANNNNNSSSSSSAAKQTNGVLPQEQPEREQDRKHDSRGNQQALQAPSRAKSSSNVSLNYLAKSQTDSQRRRRVSTMPDINIPPAPPLPPELLVPGTPLHLRKKRSVERPQQQEQQQQEIQQDATNSQDQIAGAEEGGESHKSSDSSTPKTHRVEGGLIYVRPNFPIQGDIEIESIAKDEGTRNLIRTAIERNDFLNNLMDKERKEMVINAMAPASYRKHNLIIREHEEGSEIYVSAEGQYDVIRGGQLVASFGPATVFGELAILYNAPRQASVEAATDARVWKIARETFRAIMQISGSREREENLQFLRSAPFLQEFDQSLLLKVVDLLQRKFYETDSCIVREGELGNEFYIIRCGTVTIKKRDDQQQEQIVANRKRGDYFGEQALLNADVRQASVYADAPGTEVLMLDREAFISYLGTIKQLREKPSSQRNDTSGRSSNKSLEFDNEYSQVAISELKKIATLGCGAFGRVDLVAYNQQALALKIIKKIEVVKQDQIEHVYNEKNVMIKCRQSPFIVQLYRTYRNDKYVYFLMEACMGGDVWTVMSKRQYFDEKTAKFIAGCVVEAFDYLHSHHFIYRDLKPENLMLGTDGYCKLVDFGFAKFVRQNEKTNTFAGTPEYVAPEIILDRGHDRAVDYWALGILVYELLVGKTPFRGVNQIKIYQQILSGIDVIHMPSRIPKSAQHLVRHLCKQLPAERLGYQRKGIADIKRHSWFESLDWQRLKLKQLPSPIKRPLKSWTDLQYFGPSGVENDYEPPEELSGWDKDF
ncbi:cGMP-dependent protein kinase 1 [Drosophila sechellia]|uniref:cGMP-dependent protein kinase n=1 Tax=Drosophila sechellia TaxID=7238 RepID=B4HWG4_DROSE|nr:cGMP-dependent protein kinase 1 [Drosophila sechellia]XP_032569874.1 cGMP-dependent protein kinase 1 [Drosophila sechellia]XP_032569875.1 cGMP-dependent protein kinase 1 [Drosophila sechellia]XP_032569876.1 cGMP-dependent protein kinase 1 [Drosophila sechellia]EDW52359.1 GM17960 [Drosophila sechellia]